MTIETARLTLSAYGEGDRRAFGSFLSKSFGGRVQPAALFDAFLDVSGQPTPSWRIWAVHLRVDHVLVGHVELKTTAKTARDELELVYAIRNSHRGRGIATETVAAVTNLDVDTGGRTRIVAYINPANVASRRVLEKAGFDNDSLGLHGDCASRRLVLRTRKHLRGV